MSCLTLSDLVNEHGCTVCLGDDLCQPAFACVECQVVLCRGCRHLHPHTVVPLGQRRFRCEQDGLIDPSIPNSIRNGIFCYCEKEYNNTDMWQCIGCSDWFHVDCIQQDLPWVTKDTDGDFVCRRCNTIYPFTGCQSFDSISWVLPIGWEPCECDTCTVNFGDLFSAVLELPDTDPCDVVDEANVDKASLLRTIDGYNLLKSKLSLYLQSLPDGHVVTAADIHAFMSTLHNRQ